MTVRRLLVTLPLVIGLLALPVPASAGPRNERNERVRPLVCVCPNHDHVPRPFV